MFKAENAHLGPNLLASALEEGGAKPKQTPPLLRDASNIRMRACAFSKVSKCRGDEGSLAYVGGEDQSLSVGKGGGQKQNASSKSSRPKNLLIAFDSEDENSADYKSENYARESVDLASNPPHFTQQASGGVELSKKTSSKKERGLLLIMSSEDQDQQKPIQQGCKNQVQRELGISSPVERQSSKQIQQAGNEEDANVKPSSKQQFCLYINSADNQQIRQDVEQCESVSSKQASTTKRMIIRQAGLVSRFGSEYYLQRIPFGAVFECVIKRDRCESVVKYHVFDCVSLRNFMTIIKDEQGYLIVSREVDKIKVGTSEEKNWVVGRVVSNFFGTEFNCLLGRSPYSRGCKYPVNENEAKIITIEYQTNIFGLRGPRKFSAYIPNQEQRTCQKLNEVYQKQANKKKVKPTVLRYNNKAPKWSKEINAYILNFRGRATVSSIKNFIMIGENQEDTACESVLFGKCGRQLFNLDIRYPFSIIQGVALALSSFDRKLACE